MKHCLEALKSQDFDPKAYEIVVCDDEPGEETEMFVRAFAAECPAEVRYIPVTETQGPAGARNKGWRAARGRIIAFTDDDTIPDSGWLREAEKVFESENAAAVMGRIIMPIPAEPRDYERDAAGLERAEFATANSFYLKRVLEETGGFDERFRDAWREDADLFFTVFERYGSTSIARNAVVVHPVRPAPWGISISQQRKALYNALIYKKHPRLYRERIQPGPPVLYYQILASIAACAAGALFQWPALAWTGLIAWVLLTGHFVLKRLAGNSKAPGHILEMICTSVIIPPLAVYWRIRGAFKYRVLFF